MTRTMRTISVLLGAALLASACGGTAQAPTAVASPTVAATPSPAPTPSPTPARPVVAATGQGAAVVNLGDAVMPVEVGSAPYLAPGSYTTRVSVVTLQPGGRTVAHRHGGIEALFVLEGTIDLRWAPNQRALIEAGKGAALPPNTVLQVVNGGSGVTRFLAFFFTPEGSPFQTNVEQAP